MRYNSTTNIKLLCLHNQRHVADSGEGESTKSDDMAWLHHLAVILQP